MFHNDIIIIFTLFILAIFNTKVDAKLEPGKLDTLEYIPKKGYLTKDIKEFQLDYSESLKEIYSSKTEDDLDKLDLFKTINIKTPKLWLDGWKLDKANDKLIKRYKKEMRIPDPSNNDTVYQLLVMSRNAYVPPESSDWVELTEYGWDILYPFGWNSDSNERTSNRVRGYIFKNESKKIIVVSIKGTSAGLFGIGGPTADYDKLNDNMMFSCCCAVVDVSWNWARVCNCHSGIANTCEKSCLKRESLHYDNSYYEQLMAIYKSDDIQKWREEGYDVFFTGHSLGGALASLSGLSLYTPVFTYEAPGEAQFAERIGIVPPKEDYENIPIYHFGNNGDPIYTGKCTGITSACYYSGFAMETRCHVGKMYMFDLDKNRNKDPVDDTPDDGDNPDEQPVEDPKGKQMNTQTSSSFKSKESPVFLYNKSSIDEHQFQMVLLKRSQENSKNTQSDVDPSLKFPTVPSNPSKLNMLHHRVDYVITLIKKWEGPWPEEFIQDTCKDCEDWHFIEADGDEGVTDPPSR